MGPVSVPNLLPSLSTSSNTWAGSNLRVCRHDVGQASCQITNQLEREHSDKLIVDGRDDQLRTPSCQLLDRDDNAS